MGPRGGQEGQIGSGGECAQEILVHPDDSADSWWTKSFTIVARLWTKLIGGRRDGQCDWCSLISSPRIYLVQKTE